MDRLFFEINRRNYVDTISKNSRNITRTMDSLPYRTQIPYQFARDVLQKKYEYNGQRGSLIYMKDTSIKSTPVRLDKYGNELENGRDTRIWDSTKRPVDVSGYIVENKYVNKYPVSESKKLSIIGRY